MPLWKPSASSRRHTPLVRALEERDWRRAASLVTPKAASQTVLQLGFFEGHVDATVLPLHIVVAATTSQQEEEQLQVCRLLVQRHPAGLWHAESSLQRLPLHAASRVGASFGILEMIVAAAPETCLQPDSLGRLALHYALRNHCCDDSIRFLLQAAPASAYVADQAGWTPLHVAVSAGRSVELVQRLVQMAPQTVQLRTAKGSLARHCITRDNIDPEHRKQLKRLLAAATTATSPSAAAAAASSPEDSVSVHSMSSVSCHSSSGKRASVRSTLRARFFADPLGHTGTAVVA